MKENQLNKSLIESISNPVKFRLLIEILKNGEATAKYLSEQCSDIPQTTLYRNLKRMTADGLLKISAETQIRGTVERTYTTAFDITDPQEMLSRNSGAMYMQMFLQYIMIFARQFQTYCGTPGIRIKEDMSGFSLTQLYLTDEELNETIAAVAKIFGQVQGNKPDKDRKLRTIGLIISPEQKQ